jgi:hypothetical protein
MVNQQNQQDTEGKYTGVIYFHGMGSQRRYASVSKLVDALDIFTARELWERCDPVGVLRGVKARFETNRDPSERDVSYIRANLSDGSGKQPPYANARFYEVYWAPLAADAPSLREVVTWIFRQVLVPFRILTTPWRERQRLHLAVLYRLWERLASKDDVQQRDVQRLHEVYVSFENHEAIRRYPKGTFKEFLAFLGEKEMQKARQKPEQKVRLERLCYQWRQHYIQGELLNLYLRGFCHAPFPFIVRRGGLVCLLVFGILAGAFIASSPEV